MSGGSTRNDQIAVNIIGHLFNTLRGSNCRPTSPDTAVRTAIKRVRRPDVTVECAPSDAKSYEAANPIAIFEVLSPTTRTADLTTKLAEYMRHPSLRTIVHVDPDAVSVVVYRRGDGAPCVSMGHTSLPSMMVFCSSDPPASFTRVGYQSIVCTGSLICAPDAILPGQFTKPQARTPPSQMLPL